MNQVLKALQDIVDKDASVINFNAEDKLSIYLTEQYHFCLAKILGYQFVLIEPLEEISVLRLKKQMINMEERLGCPIAVYMRNLTAYKRKKLLEERIPFISENEQIFLPFLGLSLRNAYLQKEKKRYDGFSPAAQLIFLYILYAERDCFTQREVGGMLELSPITVSRTLKQFTDLHLLECTVTGKTGRKKIYRREEKKTYFERGREFLRNPVKETVYAKMIPENVEFVKSGFSALAEKTMLGEPDHDIFAVSNSSFYKLQPYIVSDEAGMNENYPQFQIMKYDTAKLAKDNTVDEITLICSLKERDERVDMAIDEMMEGYAWYVG